MAVGVAMRVPASGVLTSSSQEDQCFFCFRRFYATIEPRCFPRTDGCGSGSGPSGSPRPAHGRVTDRPDTPDGWVTAVRRLPAISARYAAFPDAIDPRLVDALKRPRSRAALYASGRGDRACSQRRHVVITTPTASGKTLCYNAPVLSAVLQDPSARALYLFPTKALAQDQLAELHDALGRAVPAARDGDRRSLPTTEIRRRMRAGDPRTGARRA